MNPKFKKLIDKQNEPELINVTFVYKASADDGISLNFSKSNRGQWNLFKDMFEDMNSGKWHSDNKDEYGGPQEVVEQLQQAIKSYNHIVYPDYNGIQPPIDSPIQGKQLEMTKEMIEPIIVIVTDIYELSMMDVIPNDDNNGVMFMNKK